MAVVFEQNFEAEAVNETPNTWVEPWSYTVSGNNDIKVIDDPVHAGNRAARQYSGDADNAYASIQQNELAINNTQIDFYIRAAQTNKVLPTLYTTDSHSNLTTKAGINIAFWDDTKIKYNDGGSWIDSGITYNNTTWYHIRYIVHDAARTYDLYIDNMDVAIAAGIGYRNDLSCPYLSLQTGSVQLGTVYVDDITVTAPWLVTLDAFELVLTQHAPIVYPIVTIIPGAFELALTQHAPTVTGGALVTSATMELALTQHDPTVLFPLQTILPSTFELGLTLCIPTIVIPSDVTVIPDTFELGLTHHLPQVITIWTEIPSFMEKDLIDPYSDMGAWLWLAEIVVPTQTTQRIARNTEDIRYGGEDFTKDNFDVGCIPLAGDSSIPRIQLRVAQDEVGTLEGIVNATKGGVNGTVKLIRTCEKYCDLSIEALERTYDILTAGSDAQWVTFTLGIPNPLTQRIPLWSYSSKVCPLATPSLFKGPRCQYTGEDTVCTGLLEDCYAKGNAVHWGAEIGLNPGAVRI